MVFNLKLAIDLLLMSSMKTQIIYKAFRTLVLTFVASVALMSCSKNSSTGSTPAVTYSYVNGICVNNSNQQVATTYCTSNNGYTYVNGVCIATATNQQVPTNYCSNTTANNGYVYQNGMCIQISTGQQVPTNYCQNTGSNNGVSGAQQCYGYFTNGYQYGQCSGANCSGLVLQEVSSGRIIQCL